MLGQYFLIFAVVFALLPREVSARNKRDNEPILREPIVETGPTLAPFQHVRFCLRYPRDCQSSPTKNEPIQPQLMGLLKSVNQNVNQFINPRSKAYDTGSYEVWTIAPEMGDCNDYAVTKRHELLAHGLPSMALRLAVAKTPDGAGHLVLVVTTTVGNLVMDNLTEEIIPWQLTDYRWLKIQSVNDPHLWSEVRQPLADEHEGPPAKNSPG
jgi:predicted transglutaminase-like cysteine proteinase